MKNEKKKKAKTSKKMEPGETMQWSKASSHTLTLKLKPLSCVRLFVIPLTVAYQAPPSMGFSRQECCSGVPLPSPKAGLQRVKRDRVTNAFTFKIVARSVHVVANGTVPAFLVAE